MRVWTLRVLLDDMEGPQDESVAEMCERVAFALCEGHVRMEGGGINGETRIVAEWFVTDEDE